MSVANPKRIYDPEALQAWGERLQKTSWETQFSHKEISLGRQIFANNEIREIEIHLEDVIIHARFDQEECYTLLEWSQNKLCIRGSTVDKLLVRALAVAGIQEMRQLFAQEIPRPANPILPRVGEVANNGKPTIKRINPALNDVISPQRPLLVKWDLDNKKGLFFQAYWEHMGDPVPAFGEKPIKSMQLTAPERESLIRIASWSRKSGFEFKAAQGRYYLDNIEKIQAFVQNSLKKQWEKAFKHEYTSGVEGLARGLQPINAHIHLFASEQDNQFQFAWNLQAGDKVLEQQDALAVIRNPGQPVILPEHGIVQLDEDVLNSLATWKRWMNWYSGSDIPSYILFSLFSEGPIKVTVDESLKAWREDLFDSNHLAIDERLPSFLRRYQKEGVRQLWHLCDKNCHTLLADEMGLGKTIQILSLISSRNIHNAPNLIVCPASVVPVWQQEIENFFPNMKVEVLQNGHDFFQSKGDVVWLASYTQLRIHRFLLHLTEFGYVVLDEAQLIKNPEAKVTQACMHIRAKHRIVLTGTPLENRYLDLWTLFRFLMPGLLGTRKQFEDTLSVDGPKAIRKLKKQIAPFVLRRTKKEVLRELPSKTHTECICPLTDLQKKEYERLSKMGLKELGENIPDALQNRSLSFLTLLTRLRQTCCDPALLPWVDSPLESSGKTQVLLEKLSEIFAGNHKVVIFSQFVSLIDRIDEALERYFPDIKRFQLTGKTLDRAKPVEQFQTIDEPSAMLVSLRSGGTGITLHAADYVFLMDPWWNPAVEEQAIDRVHRLGQKKPIFVYRMITAGTIEARIQKLKREKQDLFRNLIGGMTDISNIQNYFKSLSDLISLLPEDK